MTSATFRSRARVIDLLGRQQIADVPTAMGELFKNSLDAGARNVWVDLSEKPQVLTIRDDGLGMRVEDVLEKWLILATDSKHSRETSEVAESDKGWMKFADDEQRNWLKHTIYGEKGIGRLSIATLGRITLLWTVWGKGNEQQGTLCLVHWHLFRHPTKLFEELPVPYIQLKSSPKLSNIASLFQELRTSPEIVDMLEDKRWSLELRKQLKNDLNIDVSKFFPNLPLKWETGTTFCIFETTDQVEDLFQKGRSEIVPSDDYPPDQLKSYHAFSTFWDPFHSYAKKRSLKIHPSISGKILQRTYRYWEPSDFKECDHHIRVEVSADGFARGFIQNYGQEKISYEHQLIRLPKNCSSPGRFLVEIGYLQGDQSYSRLPQDQYGEIEKRLKHAGGFSIYLDGVRVQPYGGVENDFAGFEERRLRNAGRYYFSSRRMFGGIFFPSKIETPLQEKAGREGFIVSGPMRGLRLWTEDLFVDLADSFFGRKSDRDDKKQRQQEKENAAAKARLAKEKVDYIESICLHKAWLRDFNQRVKEKVQTSRRLLVSELNAVPGTHLTACEEAFEALREMAVELRKTPSTPPVGVVLEGDALQSGNQYLTDRNIAILNLDKEIARQAKELQLRSSRYRSVEEQEKGILKRIAKADENIRQTIFEILSPALNKSLHIHNDLEEYAEKIINELIEIRQAELDGITIKAISQDATGELAERLEKSIQYQQEKFESEVIPKLNRLVDSISHLTDEASGSIILTEQAEELTILKERQAYLVEVAQLGLILEAANHEHEKQVDCVRSSIKQLENMLPKEQQDIVKTLSDSFEIIDSRMRLFDPLIRRRTVTQSSIGGDEIEDFLKKRFKENFEEIGLIEVTDNFRKGIWHQIKRPIFLGAIHNIFHNALYWCKKGSNAPHIRLSASGDLLTVSDSGPGVNARDVKRIFEPGFSRRPYGRGLGLYIAREALLGIGYNLYYSPKPELGALDGANFTILHKNKGLDNDHN